MTNHFIHTLPVRELTRKVYIALPLLLCSLMVFAQAGPSREYQVKAAFLYNFTQFVEWPPASFNGADAPFVIAILGDDPFGSYLDETVAGERVKGHPIVIQHYKLVKDIKHCHLLFVNPKEDTGIKELMAEIPSRILTVSDRPNFNQTGGMIRLMTRDNRIKLMINPSAVKAAELDISSKLLNVAEIFGT